MGEDSLYRVLLRWLTDPDTGEMVKRALTQGVVLDTWINGEKEERISDTAQVALVAATERWASEALRTIAIFHNYQMPEQYVRSVFHELLFSMALFAAQKKKGRREVTLREVEEAIDCLSQFISSEPKGLTSVGGLFFTVSTHEDLNAIAYYGRMKKEDFLLGRLHRPWSNLILSAQLGVYQRMSLVENLYASEGDMLSLTQRGLDVLARLRSILTDAGEFKWRAENQRWVIFAETDYDKVFGNVVPDLGLRTREYLERLSLQSGMEVLEIGAGTGRTTVDLGLSNLVGPDGSVVALDPMATLLARLAAKCRERGIRNVGMVQGVAEDLPFPDDSFDATVAVLSLHFTDAPKAIAEMVRVTKPGGFVSVLNPAPQFDVRDIPMVAAWFRPLTSMAERFGVPFSERNGLPIGLLKEIFENNLEDTNLWQVPYIGSCENYQSFLAFVLKGGAFFQNILCRLPFQERWNIMQRLEEDGAKFAEETSREEQRHVFFAEAAWGRIPARKAPPSLNR